MVLTLISVATLVLVCLVGYYIHLARTSDRRINRQLNYMEDRLDELVASARGISVDEARAERQRNGGHLKLRAAKSA